MNRGAVVEVDWLYSDQTGSKLRPAVIVQADFLNGIIDDTILVRITGTRHNISDTEVPIDPALETGSGLTKPCVVSCPNIVTMDQALILRVIGYLSDATMQQVENCLKKVLALR
jgi:mRNA-degrading endonuclease toxin of MazEF toxin-antitoxin module